MRERILPVTILGKNPDDRDVVEQHVRAIGEREERLPGEREKTRTEQQIIRAVDSAVEALCRRFGIKNRPVSLAVVRVIESRAWDASIPPPTTGKMVDALSSILLREQNSLLQFAHVFAHELLHYRSARVWRVGDAGHLERDSFRIGVRAEGAIERIVPVYSHRSGMVMYSRPGGEALFGALNEAVVETLAGRLMRGLRVEVPLRGEWTTTLNHIAALQKEGYEIDADEIVNLTVAPDGQRVGDLQGYGTERKALAGLVTEIRQRSSGRLTNDEAVFAEFVKGLLTGKVLELSRLLDRTFGPGTFRKLGECGKDSGALARLVASLRSSAGDDRKLAR